jgi:hypothetical protein
MNYKAFLTRLEGPSDLYVLPAENSLAGLRIIQDGIFLIDIVLRRKVAGVRCCPMLIQCLTYFLISHENLPILLSVATADRILASSYVALNQL